MNTVRELLLLQDKAQKISSVNPDGSAHDAVQLMANNKIEALPVLDTGKLVGIISERDFPGKAKTLDKPLQCVLVKEIMNSQVVSVSPDDTIEHCMALVTKNHISHLPVLKNDQIIGIISIGDLAKIRSLNEEST